MLMLEGLARSGPRPTQCMGSSSSYKNDIVLQNWKEFLACNLVS